VAVIRLGSIVSDIRGSVGDETFSRNQGGLFVRERVTPTDPGSAAQVLARAAVTACSQYWSGTLSQAQRDAWDTYAGQFPIPDRWGQPKHTSGYVWFLRVNIGWYRTKEALGWANPPSRPPMPQAPFTAVLDSDCEEEELHAHITLASTVDVYTGLQMYLSIGEPVNPGVAYYSAPYLTSGIDSYEPGWNLGLTAKRAIGCDEIGNRAWARVRQQDLTTGAIGRWTYDNAIILTHSEIGAGNPAGQPVTEMTYDFDFTWNDKDAASGHILIAWAIAENTDPAPSWVGNGDDVWLVYMVDDPPDNFGIVLWNTRTGQTAPIGIPYATYPTVYVRVIVADRVGLKRRVSVEVYSNPARTVLIDDHTILSDDVLEPASYRYLFAYTTAGGGADELGDVEIRNWESSDGHMDFTTDWVEVDVNARLALVGRTGFDLDPLGNQFAVQLYYDCGA